MAQAMHAKNHKALQSLAQQRQQPQNAIDSANAIKRETRKRDLQIMSTRNWRNGDVYSPHDLSLVEIKRWKGKTRPEVDVFDTLALNPISEWKVRVILGLPSLTRPEQRSRSGWLTLCADNRITP